MATSITQAKPLLTAAELELFDHSRAEPIKALSAKQLAGKEKRTRALRDKYRDLYRRQSVAVRGKASGIASKESANARTQRKAEIMQEMLDRFEARSTLLEAREARSGDAKEAKSKGKAPARKAKAPARKAASPAAPTKPSPRAQKTAANSKQRSELDASTTSASASASPAAAASRKSTAGTPLGKTKTGQSHAPEQALSAVGTLNPVKGGQTQPGHFIGKDPDDRSPKAPSPRAPTFGGKARAPEVNAPLDMVAAAKRMNPVKNSPSSQAIQGHVSSSVRRSQGKRDAR